MKVAVLLFLLGAPCHLDNPVSTVVANANTEGCMGQVLSFENMAAAQEAIRLFEVNRVPLDAMMWEAVTGKRTRITIAITHTETPADTFPVQPAPVGPAELQPQP